MITAFIISAFVIAADQISKYIIKTNMNLYESIDDFIPGILNIRYIENRGASFGILQEHRWVFMILSSAALVLMLGAIIYLGRNSVKKSNLFINISLAFMFGGGAGNMLDRFFNASVDPRYIDDGAKVVVDFLEFAFVEFAVFNIADSFICIGSVLFCICIFRGKYKLKNTDIIDFDDIMYGGYDEEYDGEIGEEVL
ncbi:MAG: signal peptidase II [Oscillospiraceae bacterium]|nr:signal peptidase II [Oscillospiraceae bacterium]